VAVAGRWGGALLGGGVKGRLFFLPSLTVLHLTAPVHCCHEIMQVVQQGLCSREAEGCERPPTATVAVLCVLSYHSPWVTPQPGPSGHEES